MISARSCYMFFFQDITVLVPSCVGADGGQYMGQAGGIVTLSAKASLEEFSRVMHEVWMSSGVACHHVKSWEDVDVSWKKVAGRKTKVAFVSESVCVTLSNENFPGQISVSAALPDVGRKTHLSTIKTPKHLVDETIEPKALGRVVLKILGEGRKLIDEGKWDTDKGRMCE